MSVCLCLCLYLCVCVCVCVCVSDILHVMRRYNHAGVRISIIHADNEFRPVMRELIESDEWDLDMNFSNPGEHVLDIEREIDY